MSKEIMYWKETYLFVYVKGLGIIPMPSGLWCKTQSKVSPSEQKQHLLIFFHDTFIPILSLPSDRDAKVFYVEKLFLGG